MRKRAKRCSRLSQLRLEGAISCNCWLVLAIDTFNLVGFELVIVGFGNEDLQFYGVWLENPSMFAGVGHNNLQLLWVLASKACNCGWCWPENPKNKAPFG